MKALGSSTGKEISASAVLVMGIIAGFLFLGAGGHEAPSPAVAKKIKKLTGLAPARGYLDAHQGVQKPLDLLGGAIHVTVSQDSGGVFVALPDNRKLDRNVFGTPKMPRAYGGTPGIEGVPPMFRESEGNVYTVLKKKTPFGDKHIVMADGRLMLDAVDATATDAATSKDTVRLKASWKDKAGNTYAVQCCKMLATHGLQFPTFGGVMTNGLLHGFTRVGTPLMPTEYTYVAFWGMGAVMKNGQVQDKPRLVHGMLTEYVRTEGYRLAHDHEVTPTRRHFHLMVAPFKPVKTEGRFEHTAVKTGFKLPNGMELPFWHVMFENLVIKGERL